MSRKAFRLASLAGFVIVGCGNNSGTQITEYAHTTAPDGTVNAYAYERSDGLTQVMLMFPRGCGSGSAAAYRSGLELDLRWIDNDNLEVVHPPGVEFQHNASGDVLQCYDRKVRVHLVPRAK